MSKEKWNFDKCRELALKCETKKEFRKKFNLVYQKAQRSKWLDEICSHMINGRNTKIYWTKEMCQKESNKYQTRNKFKTNSANAYAFALRNGWIDEICSHMVRVYKIWTKEMCQEESNKYQTKGEFQKESNGAYCASIRNNWLDVICEHMIEMKKTKGYWTKERCHNISKKYKHRSEFKNNANVAYTKSIRNGWIDEICSHMKHKSLHTKRFLYEFEELKSAYIGLTFDIETRHSSHIKKGTLFDFTIKNNISLPIPKVVGCYDIEDVSKKEIILEEEYKNSGWYTVNIAKCGGLGSVPYWTKEKCKEVYKLCNSKVDFRKLYKGAYERSRMNGWLEEIYKQNIKR